MRIPSNPKAREESSATGGGGRRGEAEVPFETAKWRSGSKPSKPLVFLLLSSGFLHVFTWFQVVLHVFTWFQVVLMVFKPPVVFLGRF